MEVLDLKRHVLDENLIEEVLESIGCHSIKHHDGNPDDYFTCANPDGDNKNAITVYENEYLACVNYTRDIQGKSKVSPDLITLVEYTLGISFFEAFKHICAIAGINVYHNVAVDIPKSLQTTRMIDRMNRGSNDEDDIPIKILDERILGYYKPYVNDFFYNDGISYRTQREFEVGYDEMTNRITIPIRSEFGDLVGVKGRIFEENYQGDLKYLYLERCPRNKILYGLYKTLDHIKESGVVLATESEKGVMQLWSMGYKNCVAFGGKKVSKGQIDKLERLGVDIVLVFDKDVQSKELESLASRFMPNTKVFAIIDTDNILEDHESPTDNKDKWETLFKNNLYLIK